MVRRRCTLVAPEVRALSYSRRLAVKRITWVVGVAMVAAAAVLTSDLKGSAATAIVDRTMVCSPIALAGGLRDLDVVARPRGAGSSAEVNATPSPGYVGVRSGGLSPTSDLVAVRARAWRRFGAQHLPPGVYANSKRCASVRTSIPLMPMGLSGPPVQWAEDSPCETAGRILVRVRAVLQSGAPWRSSDGPYFGAQSNVVEATMAIRTERGRRPIALLRLQKSGSTRLWPSSSCS
jgi:hypothetical protein